MKRSEINAILEKAKAFLEERKFELPPFAFWTPEDWARKGPECREIIEAGLGWDITDFGSGDFDRIGLFLFTLRNGTPADRDRNRGKTYAEKILIAEPDQVTPTHFHFHKMEDIINRGGGNLMVQVWNATASDQLADTPVEVSTDGTTREIEPGGILTLEPGQSVTLPPRLYHKFWGSESTVLAGEVSRVNDDNTDNRFLEPAGRFPTIEEDAPPRHLLVGDYIFT
jgi:D-lyxose ketol-isomerase